MRYAGCFIRLPVEEIAALVSLDYEKEVITAADDFESIGIKHVPTEHISASSIVQIGDIVRKKVVRSWRQIITEKVQRLTL